MNLLKQLFFIFLMTVAFSLSAMAQKQDDDKKNRPPKDPPVIVAPDKDKPKDRPKDNNNSNRPKKPSEIFIAGAKEVETV